MGEWLRWLREAVAVDLLAVCPGTIWFSVFGRVTWFLWDYLSACLFGLTSKIALGGSCAERAISLFHGLGGALQTIGDPTSRKSAMFCGGETRCLGRDGRASRPFFGPQNCTVP